MLTKKVLLAPLAASARGTLSAPNHRRAFTLIELLMVIAVIGILTAILIPSIQSVRQTARDTKSKANLREWHRGTMLYANEHGNRLPLARNKFTPAYHWPEPVGDYLGYEYLEGPWMERTNTVGTSPNHEADHPHGPDYISYGMNVNLGVTFSSAEQPKSGSHLSQVNPETVLFADSMFNWFVRPREGYLNFRNNGKAFAVMVDGSVREFEETEAFEDIEPFFDPDPDRHY